MRGAKIDWRLMFGMGMMDDGMMNLMDTESWRCQAKSWEDRLITSLISRLGCQVEADGEK